MKRWYKFWKKGRNNSLEGEDYFEYPDTYSRDDIRSVCEEWAEEVSFNNSYSYGFEDVNLPPMSWITNRMRCNDKEIKDLQDENKKLNDILKIYLRKTKIIKINKLKNK